MLTYSPANAKTKSLYDVESLRPFLAKKRKVYSLDMRSGHDCPGAKDCKSCVVKCPKSVNRSGFRIEDGPHTEFRCFSASQEIVFPALRKMRERNSAAMHKMRGWKAHRDLILNTLPKNIGVLRYHVGGDWFRESYLRGAIAAADARPDVLFYSYTKSLPFLLRLPMDNPSLGIMRPNFLLTASRGGKWDHLIDDLQLRLDLKLDHDDSHAATFGGDFALLIHGVQPKGSEASAALSALKGEGSYARK
jgi:hypothetical protein